jgi:uncharacterized protein (TIGR02231 family)
MVLDEDLRPLPGVNVIVKGSTIGAVTDFDGHYSIALPNWSNKLEFSFIGYNTQTVQVTNPIMNVNLVPDANELDEVVVTSIGSKRHKKALGYALTDQLQGQAAGVQIRGANSLSIALEQIENQTTVDFEIKEPYSIKSDNKNYAVDMANYKLDAFYQYYCVPKIQKDAFLLASIVDWEKYNLMEGEANIFFEDTYVGQTILDVRHATDTLKLSLGRDKNVSVNREKIKDFGSKKFIGSKKEDTREWQISVKNNKNQAINLLIFDQVPVSTSDEIKVAILSKSQGKFNPDNGEIKWNLTLDSGKNRQLKLKYSVKYPKNKYVILE